MKYTKEQLAEVKKQDRWTLTGKGIEMTSGVKSPSERANGKQKGGKNGKN